MISSPGPFVPSEVEGRKDRVSTESIPSDVTGGVEGLDTNGSLIPRHIAIIMDGNGRWATARGLPRVAGHRAGAEALRKTLKAAVKNGVDVLTVYAFSSENWRRSDEEIADLTGLMRYYLDREIEALHREGVRIRIIGDLSPFGSDLTARIEKAIERTSNNDRLTAVIALNYGSRAEIARAAAKLAEKCGEDGLDPSTIDEAALEAELYTADLPDPDLIIRTSGEQRLSNFLMWQSAYAEMLFLDVLWPDFDEKAFEDALNWFAARERRFGGR